MENEPKSSEVIKVRVGDRIKIRLSNGYLVENGCVIPVSNLFAVIFKVSDPRLDQTSTGWILNNSILNYWGLPDDYKNDYGRGWYLEGEFDISSNSFILHDDTGIQQFYGFCGSEDIQKEYVDLTKYYGGYY